MLTLWSSQAVGGLIFQIDHTAVLNSPPSPLTLSFATAIPPNGGSAWVVQITPEQFGKDVYPSLTVIENLNESLHEPANAEPPYWRVTIGNPLNLGSRAFYRFDDFYTNGPNPGFDTSQRRGPVPILQSFEPLLSGKWANVELRGMRMSLSEPVIANGKWTATQTLKLYDTFVPEPAATALLVVGAFALAAARPGTSPAPN